jgi:tRNA U34 5-methylaminomethyl-2-thiouridine-forming methyltransferase MnmC
VAELGFGTGLNFLATLQAWRAAGVHGALHFTSFEAFPMSSADLKSALRPFAELGALGQEFAEVWAPDGGVYDFGAARLTVVLGDARATLPDWHARADAWYLDGISPAKNPELWSPELMAEVAAHTAPGGTCATYTAAGFVRRGLADAGFDVQRVPGFGRKRHMSRGVIRHTAPTETIR